MSDIKTKILFRASTIEESREMETASRFMEVVKSRTQCFNSIIIGRYSTLPYYHEVENDLGYNRCKLINSNAQHLYIANFDWYHDVVDFTPKTYFSLQKLIESKSRGPFVIKGRTNSRKYQWSTHMFARTFEDVLRIYQELSNDYMLGRQELVFREYEPLVTYDIGLNGIRFANEWRLFYWKTQRLCHGYYWSTADDDIIKNATITDDALNLADHIAKIISRKTTFFVLDIAQTEKGNWILIEVNDGSMSGLSECRDFDLYCSLSMVTK